MAKGALSAAFLNKPDTDKNVTRWLVHLMGKMDHQLEPDSGSRWDRVLYREDVPDDLIAWWKAKKQQIADERERLRLSAVTKLTPEEREACGL